MMKRLCIMLLFNSLFIHVSVGQTLIQQIENIYNALDSTAYIDDIILAYKEDLLTFRREMEDLDLDVRGIYDNMDSLQRQHTLDSVMEKYDTIVFSYREDLAKDDVWEEIHSSFSKQIAQAYLNLDGSILRRNIYERIWTDFTKISLKRRYSKFVANIKHKPVHFVLNLRVDSCGHSICLLPDTSRMPFYLFDFGKNYKDGLYVYCSDGQYEMTNYQYETFSQKFNRKAPKAFRRIIRKQPKYLFYCSELEGMNTILYLLNDKIYVYRIIQMKEYELSDYIEIVGISK